MKAFGSLLYVLCGIFETVCLVSVLSVIFQLRERKRVLSVITGIIGTASFILTGVYAYVTPFSEDAGFIPEMVTFFLPLIMTFTILNVKKNLAKSIGVSLLIISTCDVILGIIGFAIDIDSYSYEWTLIDNGIVAASFLALSLFVLCLSKRINWSLITNVYEIIPKWLIPVWVFLTFVVYCFTEVMHDSQRESYMHGLFGFLFSVAGVCILACIVYFGWKIFTLSFRQTQILKQLDEQHTNYEKMLASDRQLRHFRHDYKNHMLVVTALLNAGKTEEASEYLEAIKVESGVKTRQISTGNFVADAILNNKNSLADDLGIKMNFTGVIPEKGIAPSDICTVLGNLVDNAVEGNERYIGEKYINIEASSRDPFFVLSVANPVNEKVKIKNNRIKTTKGDSKNHGIGLKNVDRIAEKYNGKFRLDCDEHQFTADISFKLNDK